MKRLIQLCFLLFAYSVIAQQSSVIIKGKVTDDAGEAIPFANVYINNSTIGTTTDPEGNYHLKVDPGHYELNFSFVGFESHQIKIQQLEPGTIIRNAKLKEYLTKLGDVTVTSRRDKEWDKFFRKFEKTFFGESNNSKDCEITNKWVIDIEEDHFFGENGITATASEPLQIVNQALGYKITYELMEFHSSGMNFMILGNAFFQEMEPADQKQRFTWSKNREQAYDGSLKNILRCFMHKNLSEQGFELYTYLPLAHISTPRSNIFYNDLEKVVEPYKDVFVEYSADKKSFRIPVKRMLEVHYSFGYRKYWIYKDVSAAIGWLEMKRGHSYIEFDGDGNILNPRDFNTLGYLSSYRVADMLPRDYLPSMKLYGIQSQKD